MNFNFDDLYYYEDELLPNGEILLGPEESAHIIKVKRFKEGSTIFLTNGSGLLSRGHLISTKDKRAKIKLDIVEHYPKIREIEVYLASALLKRQAFEWMLEKVTELNVDAFIPLLAERVVADKSKPDRWNKVITSAVKQSKQVWKPRLEETCRLQDLRKKYPDVSWICFHEKSDKYLDMNILKSLSNKIGIVIGPEGGFTSGETEYFSETYLLSESRLRAETAAITAINQIDLLYRWTLKKV